MAVWPDFTIRDFSAGMIDKVDDNLLPENAARDCCNFICNTVGMLEKRPGQARLNGTVLTGAPHGMYAYYTDTLSKLLVTAGTKMSVWNPTTSLFDDLKTGLNGTALMLGETCANYAVFFNGVDAPFKWDGTTVSALANAPANGKYPILFKEKLFCVPVTEPSQIWWSETFDPEDWPAVNYWTIKDGDGDSITCMRVFVGEMVIFKNRSLHSFRGTDISDFRLTELDPRIGCVGPQAACNYGNGLYFVSEQGLYRFNGVSAASISSDAIPILWQDINQEYIGNACAVAWKDKVWFALPLQNQITFKVTAACTVAGDITITLGGIAETVSLTTDDNTVGEVATKVAALAFEGWTLTVNTDTVTFTRDELRQPLELTLSAGSTGVTATITEVDQTTNNLVLMYNPSGGTFWPMKNINASGFQDFNDGTQLLLYSGDASSGYVNQQDTGTEDFGSPVSAYWVGKGFDVQKADHLKKCKRAYIEDYPYQLTPATLKVSLDYGDFHEWTYKRDDDLVREYRIPSEYKVKWRYLTPRFSHASAGKCQIRGLTIPYKAKKKPKGRSSS